MAQVNFSFITEKLAAVALDSNADRNAMRILQLILSKQSCQNEQILQVVESVRKMSSREKLPPFKEIIETNICELLQDTSELIFQQDSYFENFHLNYLWTLTNLCAGNEEHVNYTIQQCDSLKYFSSFILCDNPILVEQAIWGLGNITGENLRLRNLVLSEIQNFDYILVSVFNTHIKHYGIRANITWTLSNIMRYEQNLPQIGFISQVFPIIEHNLKILHTDRADIIIDSLWGIHYLFQNDVSHSLRKFINERILPLVDKIVTLFRHENIHFKTTSLQIIGNMFAGPDEWTDILLQKQLLKDIFKLCFGTKTQTKKEAYWIITNVAAGTKQQEKILITHPSFQTTMLSGSKDESFEIRKRVLHTLMNLLSSQQAMNLLISGGFLFQLINEFIFGIKQRQLFPQLFEKYIMHLIGKLEEQIQSDQKLVNNTSQEIQAIFNQEQPEETDGDENNGITQNDIQEITQLLTYVQSINFQELEPYKFVKQDQSATQQEGGNYILVEEDSLEITLLRQKFDKIL